MRPGPPQQDPEEHSSSARIPSRPCRSGSSTASRSGGKSSDSASFREVNDEHLMRLHRHWIWANYSKRQSEEALREEGWSDVETGSPEFRGRCSFGTDCRTPSSLVAHRAVSGTAANWLKTSESYASRYETPGMLFSTSSETSITTTIASRELCAKAPSSSRVSTSARNLLSRRLLLLSSRSRLPFG
jgi:hypothetical protein